MLKKHLLPSLLAVLAGGAAAWWWLGKDGNHLGPTRPSDGHGHATGSRTPATAVATTPSLKSSVAPGAPVVRTESTLPPSPETEPAPATAPRAELQPEARAELEAVGFMLRDFRTRMNENPVGSNAEIMRAVMGGNSAHATLGPPTGQTLNADGELVDRWGTPYFFHQLSKTSMEIRSAGPDRQMWTADDLVTK